MNHALPDSSIARGGFSFRHSLYRWLLPALTIVFLAVASTTTLHAVEQEVIQRLAQELNPARVDVNILETGPFVGETASTVAEKVKSGTWFSFLVFLPFLVLPEVLLLIIIFKFRAGARKNKTPATFTHNTKLEIVWTAIPVLALLVVAVPITRLLDYQETPPAALAKGEAFTVEVICRQYNWLYQYPETGLHIGSYAIRELPKPRVAQVEGARMERLATVQEAAVFPLGATVTLFLTATDVNHAWWVPAFAVKKDCFPDRTTHTWFKPTKTGFFEGTCAELCGADHGIMKITAAVLEPDDFRLWVLFKTYEQAALRVVEGLRNGTGDEAFAAYVEADGSANALAALRFWFAYDKNIHSSIWQEAATRKFAGGIDGLDDYFKILAEREAKLNALVDSHMLLPSGPAVKGTDV